MKDLKFDTQLVKKISYKKNKTVNGHTQTISDQLPYVRSAEGQAVGKQAFFV